MDTAISVVSAPASSHAEPTGLTSWDAILGGIAAVMGALLPIAISAATASQTFTVKYALLLVLAAVGIVPLVRLGWSSRYEWQARAAIAFVLVGAISAAVSPSRLVGFFGLYEWGEGELFLLGLAAAWAVGVCLTPRTRRWLVVGLLVGSTANAVAAVLQTALSLNTPQADLSGFGLFGGSQADGMMGNPVHLEAILLGGLALLIGPLCRSRLRSWQWFGLAFLVALHGAALECSSERYGILLAAVVLVVAVVIYRLRAVTYVVALAVGFVATFLAGAGVSLSQRVATANASSTYKLRLHAAYTGSVATLLHRPLLGFGPGEVRNAIEIYQSRAFATQVGPDRYFTDLHDLFANILVMTGVLGFVLFAAFFVGSAWGARGGLAGFAAIAFAVELAEPMNVGVTPLAFLALGAALGASRGTPWRPEHAPRARSFAAALALGIVALLPAVVLVAGDVELHRANSTFSLAAAQDANNLLPIWPQTADAVAQVWAYQSIVDLPDKHSALVQSRNWGLTAANRDPSDNGSWTPLTAADLALGDEAAANAIAMRAVADCGYCAPALTALGTSDGALGDWAGAAAAYRSALAVDPHDKTLEVGLQKVLAHDRTFFQEGGA